MAQPRCGVGFKAQEAEWMALIARTACEDQPAFGILYDQTSPIVFGLALRILGDHASAEEVTTDVYLQVWRQAKFYDVERGSPLTWLMTIARSRAVDRFRQGRIDRTRRDSEEALEGMAAGPGYDPHEQAAIEEERRRVGKALAALPPAQRQLIELAYYDGLSQTEIAAKVGQPLGTVKTRVRLGMIKLRELLAPAVV